MIDRIAKFMAGVFSDNGQPSFSRVGAGMALAFGCGWITAVVKYTHALPDFAGISLFIGTLYGLNLAGNVLRKPGQGQDQGK